MSTEFDLVIAEEFTKPTTSEEEFRAACHPLMKVNCPSIPALEKIACGKATLRQWLHQNTCAYCQKSVGMFREMFDDEPLTKQKREAAQRVVGYRAAFAGVPGTTSVTAEVLLPDLSFKQAEVHLLQRQFTKNGLGMLIQLARRLEGIGDEPIELTVVNGANQQMFGPFVLPKLNFLQKEEILVSLPSALQEDWRKKIEQENTIPFQFILRPYAVSEVDR